MTRLAEERFQIVTGTAFGRRDLAWIRSHLPDDDSVRAEDVTSRFTCLGLWAPSREILQPLTEVDLGNDSSHMRAASSRSDPFLPGSPRHVRGRARLGALLPHGVRPAPLGHDLGRGPRATSSPAATRRSTRSGSKRATGLGRRHHSDETPYEAALDFAVKLDKGDFIGREALLEAKGSSLERKLTCLVPPGCSFGCARLRARPGGRRCRRAG